MPPQPAFINDKVENLVRKCVVFPADGSGVRLVHMIARTVTLEDDNSWLRCHDRCIDMVSTYEDEYSKLRVVPHEQTPNARYLIHYNMSPNLPLNLTVAGAVGSSSFDVKADKRLFWRGDVAVLKTRRKIPTLDFVLETLDADEDDFGLLEDVLRKQYQDCMLEKNLQWDEYIWKTHGEGGAFKLNAINELLCLIGEPPIQPQSRVNSFSDKVSSAYSTFQALLGYQTASSDPISEETICLQSSQELGRFHSALKNTAQRVKNLAIIGMFNGKESEIDTILAMCNGVENLLVSAAVYNLGFFTNPQAGHKLRRLTIQLRKFKPPSGSKPNFYHPCFSNITHLHLDDDDDDWPTYQGWDNLSKLTHLAISCSGPPESTLPFIQQKLPTVRYAALVHYRNGEDGRYCRPTVNNEPHIRAKWGARVVFLSSIHFNDWKRGARGDGDFWDIVEREVERRLRAVSDGASIT